MKGSHETFIAFASDDGERISEGHFAHARRFAVYRFSEGKYRLEELRDNPLGHVPDLDAEGDYAGGGLHGHFEGLHGVEKYAFLKKSVLEGVDVVVAGGACMTSVAYFLREGVRLVFAEPGTRIEDVAAALSSHEGGLPEIGLYMEGKIVDVEELS